jgi:hypothetical protein
LELTKYGSTVQYLQVKQSALESLEDFEARTAIEVAALEATGNIIVDSVVSDQQQAEDSWVGLKMAQVAYYKKV